MEIKGKVFSDLGTQCSVVGRFAPSPSGRMHLGNIYTAVISWLSAKRAGGRLILRIEDLDPQRSKRKFAEYIEEDLRWLGLDWDEGGLDNIGENGPYLQSQREKFYMRALQKLSDKGLLYPCRCKRRDILATQAPHQSDGRVVYPGTCRPDKITKCRVDDMSPVAMRVVVPDEMIVFSDRVFGTQSVNLAKDCGDFIVRRADGAWGYQLAVVVDDALMGVNEVVRGEDLLLSTAQQIYLYRELGYDIPIFCHLPLIKNEYGERLSKRDSSMSMEEMRLRYHPEDILGMVAKAIGIEAKNGKISLDEMLSIVKNS